MNRQCRLRRGVMYPSHGTFSSCNSAPGLRLWSAPPAPFPSSEKCWGPSVQPEKTSALVHPVWPPGQRCPHCRRSGRSPWCGGIVRWKSEKRETLTHIFSLPSHACPSIFYTDFYAHRMPVRNIWGGGLWDCLIQDGDQQRQPPSGSIPSTCPIRSWLAQYANTQQAAEITVTDIVLGVPGCKQRTHTQTL